MQPAVNNNIKIIPEKWYGTYGFLNDSNGPIALFESDWKEDSLDSSETMTAKSEINDAEDVNNSKIQRMENISEISDNHAISLYNHFSINNNSYSEPPIEQITKSHSSYIKNDLQHRLSNHFDPTFKTDAQENCRNWLTTNNLRASDLITYNTFIMNSKYEELNDPDKLSSSFYSSVNNYKDDLIKFNQPSQFFSPYTLSNCWKPCEPYYCPEQECVQPTSMTFESMEFEHNLKHFNNFESQLVTASSADFLQKDQQLSVLSERMLCTHSNQITNQIIDDSHKSSRDSEVQNNFIEGSENSIYWPQWSSSDRPEVASRTGGRWLENTLNLFTPNLVDYSKFNTTISVYMNKNPIMTFEKDKSCSKFKSYSPELRQHNFASNWLLYKT